MSTAAQLFTENLAVNIDYQGNITDLCWPDRDQNLLLRDQISYLIFADGKPLTANFKLDLDNYIPGKLFTLYSDDENYQLKITYTIAEAEISQQFLFTNKHENSIDLDIFITTSVDFNNNLGRDSACFYPPVKGIVHYEGNRYLATSADIAPDEYACQAPEDFSGRGAKPDYNLNLSKNPVTTGKVQSCLKYSFIASQTEVSLNVRYILGDSYKNITEKYKNIPLSTTLVNDQDPYTLPSILSELGLSAKDLVKLELLAKTSRAVLRSSHSSGGGIIAAIDSSSFKLGGVDDYSYCWPRDAALVLLAEIKDAKKSNIPITNEFIQTTAKSVNFLGKTLNQLGYLDHRYKLDGTLGSSWHSWISKDGQMQLPLQLDETALMILLIEEYLSTFPAVYIQATLDKLPLLTSFLVQHLQIDYIHQACYDIWENSFGHFSMTQGLVGKALNSLANIYRKLGTEKHTQLITDLNKASSLMISKLKADFNISGRLIRVLDSDDIKGKTDHRADASLHLLWQFDVLNVEDELLKNSIEYCAEKLSLGNGGFARFEEDNYVRENTDFTGNPWYISTIWFSKYYIQTQQYEKALQSLKFVIDHSEPTGILPEMADPITGFAKSIRPLAWSHAEFLNLLNWDYTD